jgi:hypothetical protein
VSKANYAFKETDFARAIRVAQRAGLKEFTVSVTTPDGRVFEIRSGQTTDEGEPGHANRAEANGIPVTAEDLRKLI